MRLFVALRFCVVCLGLGVVARAAVPAVWSDIEYREVGGESLKLDAWVPEGAGPFPAVILVHGGGWTAGDKTGGPRKALIAPMFEPLQAAGIAWFSISYRLAPKHRYPANIEDVEAAIRWVKTNAKKFRVDRTRLALAGESAGGHLVALAAVRADASTRVRAVVPFYTPFDLVSRVTPGGEMMPNYKALFGRETVDEESLRVLREASPLTHAKAGLPPFLLLHGTKDERVPFEQSQRWQARMKELGVPCELIVVEGGAHGMGGWEKLSPGFREKVVSWISAQLR